MGKDFYTAKEIIMSTRIANYHYDAFIREGMKEEFDLLYQQIFNSKFITKMSFDCIVKKGIPEDIFMLKT